MSNIIAVKSKGITTYSYVNIYNIFRFLTEEEFEEFNKLLNKYNNKGIYINKYQESYNFSNIKKYIEDIEDIKTLNKYFKIN